MPALWMEWGQDLQPNPQGGLLLAYGPDEVRQGIIRELLTTAAITLDSGQQIQPEFYLDPTFGQSLRILVGENLTPAVLAGLKQRITNTVLKNHGVNSQVPPSVQGQSVGHLTFLVVGYVLTNGQPSKLALQIGG